VWLFFLLLGMVQMWLSRRRLIRHCRRLFKKLPPAVDATGRPLAGESFPLWARPLRSREPWAKAMLNSVSTDAVTDPLGAFAFALLILCVSVSVVVVVPMGLIANSLLSTTGWTVERSLHGALLCLLTAGVLTLVVTWSARPSPLESDDRVEAIGRRTWLVGLLATAGVSGVYAFDTNRNRLSKLLLNPRYRKERPSFRTGAPRIRRARRVIPEMPPGFYADQTGQIHLVPKGGRARSLGGLHPSDLTKWDGPYDESVLRHVHASARVPFVVAAVRLQLKGLTHRGVGGRLSAAMKKERLAQKARINIEKKEQFERTFNLVRNAIEMSSSRGADNSRLYGLLRSIALNSQNTALVQQAVAIQARGEVTRIQRSQERARAQRLQPLAQLAHSGVGPTAARAAHSRHSGRKRRKLSKKLRYLIQKYNRRLVPDLPPSDRASLEQIARNYLGRNVPASAFQAEAFSGIGARLTPQETAEVDVLKRVIQKAAAGEDFSVDLALVSAESKRSSVVEYGIRAISVENANSVHVARRRKKPRARRKASHKARVVRRPFIDVE
jgi:hypothetical protein